MHRFPEKRVAITGAASGLGLATARHFLSRGWRVAFADVQDDTGNAIVASLGLPENRAFYQHVDVIKVRDIQAWRRKIVELWGGLDILVNNAGVAAHGGIGEAPLEDWEWVIDIDLMGVVRGCKEFAPLFKRQRSGQIVNIASMAGLVHAPEMGSYNAAKAGVVALSETLVGELSPFGVGVNVVCPGFFSTGLASTARSPNPKLKETMEKLFAGSKLSAADVAERLYEGVDKQHFYILPHANYRLLWWLKRYAPGVYLRSMKTLGRRLLAKRQDCDDSVETTEKGRAVG
ncbi:SDR family oxidoreductase [Hahella sp. NBU794]|uniref:SDR family oxidoreductase n=1 Tax=Hahella sp. NBU794 TaxID=3422590 RepID=UPI003D6FD4B9